MVSWSLVLSSAILSNSIIAVNSISYTAHARWKFKDSTPLLLQQAAKKCIRQVLNNKGRSLKK
jgi:hypothetical protein